MANQFFGKSVEELEGIRVKMKDALDDILVVTSLAESIQGKKWIKRLESDLAAVRAKYFQIKGGSEERLRELAKLQGREEQLKGEIDLFLNAVGYHKRLLSDTESLSEALVLLNKTDISR